MAKPNWKKVAHEYITTDIAMRPLADKYGIPHATLKQRAKRELWTQQRNDYRLKIGLEAKKKIIPKSNPEANPKEVDEVAMLFEGATLAINWIIKRLESDEVSDWREVEGLIRAMNGAKALTRIKSALDEEEQRARIENLKKNTEVAGREPVQIEFVNTEDTPK